MKFKSNIEVQAGIEDKDGQVGSNGQILASTGSQVDWIDPANIVTSATDVIIECKNTSGVTIAKGTPVYQTGNVGATAVIEVAVADASDEDKMAAIGLLQSDLINNAFGYVVVTGELLNITTSPIDGVTPTTGDTIYVKPGGGLTLTKPTGVNFIQNVGLVGKVSGGNAGSLTVSSIMRSNDVPTPLYIDHDNQILGIGTTSPSVYHKLDVNGSANFSADIVVGRNATALSFDMNPAYDSGNYYLNLHKNQSNDGGVLLYSKPTSGSAQIDWQIVNQGTTGDLKFYAAGLAGNALVLDRETGNLQLPEYGAGTLVSDASGNITVSSGGGAGGPYLPLSAGASYPLTGDLYIEGADKALRINNGTQPVVFLGDGGANTDGQLILYSSTGGVNVVFNGDNQNHYIANGNVGIGTTSPSQKLDVNGTALIRNTIYLGDDIQHWGDGGTGMFFGTDTISFKNDGGNTRIHLASGGNVGIGTTSPSAKLEIRGTVNTDDCKIYLKENNIYGAYFKYDGDLNRGYIGGITGTTTENAVLSWSRDGSELKLVTSGSTAVTIDSNRDVTFAEDIIIKEALLSNQKNTDVSGLELVANVLIASYTAAFFDFVIKKGTNVRSGTVYACHDGTNVEFTETSTNDLGDTSDVVLSVDISGTDMRLLADAATSGWSVKSLIRAI